VKGFLGEAEAEAQIPPLRADRTTLVMGKMANPTAGQVTLKKDGLAGNAVAERGLSWRLGELIGQVLATSVERPLARMEVASIHVDSGPGGQA